LAKFLNLETNFLIKTYLEKPENPPNEKTSSKPSRLWTIGVALNGYCKFFDPNPKACLIHSVKPLSCRLWPFYHLLINSKDGFLEAQTHCPGLNELDYGAFLAAFENSDWKVIPARLRAQLLAEGDEPLAKSPGGFD
jgi:Fe-S-cluster containining protein